MSSSSLPVPRIGHEDALELDVGRVLEQRLLGDRDAGRQRQPLDEAAVDEVGDEPEDHPGARRPRGRRRGGRRSRRTRRRSGAARGSKAAAPTVPRMRTPNGTEYGRSRSGSVKRSRISDRCAIEIASVAPNAKTPASSSMSPGRTSPIANSGGDHDRDVRGRSRAAELAEPARDLAVGREHVGVPGEAEHRHVRGEEEDQGRDRDDRPLEDLRQPLRREGRRDAEHRRVLERRRQRRGRAVGAGDDRQRHQRDERHPDVDERNDERARAEHVAEVLAAPGEIGGEVGRRPRSRRARPSRSRGPRRGSRRSGAPKASSEFGQRARIPDDDQADDRRAGTAAAGRPPSSPRAGPDGGCR